MSNTISDLLHTTLYSGEVPDDAACRAAVTRYSSVAERTAATRRVRIAAKNIRNALDAGEPEAAERHAAEQGELLAEHTKGGDTGPTPRALASELPRSGTEAQMVATGAPARSRAADPLRDLLRGAVRGGVRAADLDTLELHSEMSAEDRAEWRGQALSEARAVERTYRGGNQAAARRLADQAASSLGAAMVEPEHVDPAAGITDPRELAALAPRTRGHN